ncbi:arginine deiminase-related protein [Legionella shakespearei]|uniref:Amidinotransferase n=1 Tax=Legionella shakespearei DSM 23087 TaxID=1122169 RepID=A0A0W0Z545_9GAMM|nr:arginine deiminase-related protein [Legionella shakespearei]KTD64221.1 Amidinotransferase [Legionella shakespearei DSM 23087]
MSLKSSTVLMVPPNSFQFNPETATSNTFQSELHIDNIDEIASREFTDMVARLRAENINVLILEQNKELPDAVFPNNWFSTHCDSAGNNLLIIYPMLARNRQAEVNIDGLTRVFTEAQFKIDQIIDLRNQKNEILEGTGSLVLDRENRLLYAALSPRTSANLVEKVARILNYKAIVFHSVDEHNHPIYHTNVILSVTRNYAIICLDSIKSELQKKAILRSFDITNKLVINISLDQVSHMCGNVFELYDEQSKSILVLSHQAKEHFTAEQLNLMQKYSKLISVEIPVIETVGGGSSRCMMAEIDFGM